LRYSGWKRPFQENKDWNRFLIYLRPVYHRVKAPIPRKQGLKLKFQISSYPNYPAVKAPIPRKQGLKLAHIMLPRYLQWMWKRPFQENKDWNCNCWPIFNTIANCESAHSKKTRIETTQSIRDKNQSGVKAPIPRKQGLKHYQDLSWKYYSLVKAPIPRKQGLKLRAIKKIFSIKKKWKRPFQENKDWNS